MLRRRRDELVMMPHAIRRVYVARRARTAASIVIALIGSAFLITAAKPSLAAFFAQGLPGINPAVLCTFIVGMWLAGLFAYAAARGIDEHRFAVAMSRLVMPGKDINEDVERLAHEHPDQAARDMAHRLEVRSAALPVLAAGVLMPVTALYIAASVRAGGWPVIAEFEASVAVHSKQLIMCAVAGGVLAVVMTKRAARLPMMTLGMLFLAGGVAGTAVAVGKLWLIAIALVLGYAALVVRRLRIERDQLDTEDPAAGSEIFTIRGFIKQVRETTAVLVARVRKLRWRTVAMIGAAWGIAMVAFFALRGADAPAAKALAKPATPVKTVQIDTAPTGSTSKVELMGDGQLRIDVELVDDQALTIPALVGMKSIPMGWNMRVEVQLLAGSGVDVTVWPGEELMPLSNGLEHTFTKQSCGMSEAPFGLQIKAPPGHYRLRVAPVLEPAGC